MPGLRPGFLGFAAWPPLGEGGRLALAISPEFGVLLTQLLYGCHGFVKLVLEVDNLLMVSSNQYEKVVSAQFSNVFGRSHSRSLEQQRSLRNPCRSDR